MGANFRRALAILLIGNGLLRVAASAGGMLLGVYLASLHAGGATAGAGTAGTLGAVGFVAELIFSLPLGLLADALSPRWLMVAGAILGAASVQIFALTTKVPVFYLARLLEGVDVAAVTPSLLAFVTGRTDRDAGLRTRAMSFFELSLMAGLALGALAGTQLWHHLGRGAFSALALLYLAAGLLFFLDAKETSAGELLPASTLPIQSSRAVLQQFRRALREPAVRELAPVWLCVNAVTGLWLGPTLAFLLTEHRTGANNFDAHHLPLQLIGVQRFDGMFAADPQRIGWIVLVYAILFAIGVTGWSFVLPRMNVRTAMRISLFAMAPVCVGFFLVNHSSDWATQWRWTAGIATALLILVESGFTPAALTWLATALGSGGGKGGVMGLYSLLLSLGAVIGSLLAGLLGHAFRFDGLLLGTVLLALVGLLLLNYATGVVPSKTRISV